MIYVKLLPDSDGPKLCKVIIRKANLHLLKVHVALAITIILSVIASDL